MAKLFAIKDAMDVRITPVNQEDPLMVIEYLNDCSISKEAETTYAKKKGANAIAFASAPTGTFTMNSELADVNWLGMSLGGEVSDEKILVSSIAPSTVYKIEGTFRCTEEDGTVTIRSIRFPNTKPQPKSEISFSAENVASFSLIFDLMVDQEGVLMEIDTPKAPEVISVGSIGQLDQAKKNIKEIPSSTRGDALKAELKVTEGAIVKLKDDELTSEDTLVLVHPLVPSLTTTYTLTIQE